MKKLDKDGIEVTLDIETVEHVTTRYLMELYTQLQKDITTFIRDRVDGKPATLSDWQEYNRWHESSDNLRETLMALMQYDEYSAFVEKVYKKFYPIKKD